MEKEILDILDECETIARDTFKVLCVQENFRGGRRRINNLLGVILPKIKEELDKSWQEDLLQRLVTSFYFCHNSTLPLVYSKEACPNGLVNLSDGKDIDKKTDALINFINTLETFFISIGKGKLRNPFSECDERGRVDGIRMALRCAYNELGSDENKDAFIDKLFKKCHFVHNDMAMAYAEACIMYSNDFLHRWQKYIENKYGLDLLNFYKYRYGVDSNSKISANLGNEAIYENTQYQIEKSRLPDDLFFGQDENFFKKSEKIYAIYAHMNFRHDVEKTRVDKYWTIGLKYNHFEDAQCLVDADALNAIIGNNVNYKANHPNSWNIRYKKGSDYIASKIKGGTGRADEFLKSYIDNVKADKRNFFALNGYSPLLSMFDNYFFLEKRNGNYKKSGTSFDFVQKDFRKLLKSSPDAFKIDNLGIDNDTLKALKLPSIESYFVAFPHPLKERVTLDTKNTRKRDKQDDLKVILNNDALFNMVISGKYDEKTSLFVLNDLEELGTSYFEKLLERPWMFNMHVVRRAEYSKYPGTHYEAGGVPPLCLKVIAYPNDLPQCGFVNLDLKSNKVCEKLKEQFLHEDDKPSVIKRFWFSLANIRTDKFHYAPEQPLDFDEKMVNKVIVPATVQYLKDNPRSSISIIVAGSDREGFTEKVEKLMNGEFNEDELEKEVRSALMVRLGMVLQEKVLSKLALEVLIGGLAKMTSKLPLA